MRDSRNIATYPPQASTVPSDSELLVLFQTNSAKAWRLFIDRYADGMFSLIRSLGFDYDQAMDRFTYVCEKLCEKDFFPDFDVGVQALVSAIRGLDAPGA